MKGKPAFIIRQGSSIVRVYKFKDGRFCLYYRKHAGAPPKRETVTGEKNARGRALDVALALANGRADVLELTSADRDSYLHAKSLLPPGVPLHVVVEEWLTLRREKERASSCPASERIVRELLDTLADRTRSVRYIKPLSRDLSRVALAFPHLDRVTEDEFRAWLRALKGRAGAQLGARRRDNMRDAAVRLARFARYKNYLEDRKSAFEKVERIWEGADVETFAPEELSQFLEHINARWKPWLLIAAFAGLRTSEILRLDWSSVKFEQRVIAVSRKVARKIRISRLVPISDNLLAWLTPYRDRIGRLYANNNEKTLERALERELDRLGKAVGIKWRRNGLRHSFGSNRLAIVKSFHQVALEMGNSPARVRENYNDPKSEAEGLRYFSITPPEQVHNILPLEFR